GPVITITSPANNDVIGGRRTLEFTIVDMESGINTKKVSVYLNQVPNPYNGMNGLWTPQLGLEKHVNVMYTFQIDAETITSRGSQINVIVEAEDNADNKSQSSASYYFDTSPPSIDLDPAFIQDVKLVDKKPICSVPFDPVGYGALNDASAGERPVNGYA